MWKGDTGTYGCFRWRWSVAIRSPYQVWKGIPYRLHWSRQLSLFRIRWWEEATCNGWVRFITAWSPAWVTKDWIRGVTPLGLDHPLISANTHCGDGGDKFRFAARFIGTLTLDRLAFLHRTSSLVYIIADSRDICICVRLPHPASNLPRHSWQCVDCIVISLVVCNSILGTKWQQQHKKLTKNW